MKDYKQIISIIQDELQQVDRYLKKMILTEKSFLSDKFLDFCFYKAKKIRSVTTILFIKSIFGKVSPLQIRICALVELLHNASLIHDDIIDNSDLRRNKPSFNNLFDNKTAVLAGDFLLASALKELSEINIPQITVLFSKALLKICSGEIEQISEKNKIISIDKYLEKSEKKTSELFKLAINCSLFAERQTQYLNIGNEFGKSFGIAFQIRDDLLNFTSQNCGKPSGNDILQGIYTAPSIYYFNSHEFEKIDETTIEKIKKSSAISETKIILEKFVKQTLDLTKNFTDNQYKQALTDLCRLLEKA
ncbi:MAG: polyprenyl synthetase family protein [Candidatus Gastranaerophilaceae bacterium]